MPLTLEDTKLVKALQERCDLKQAHPLDGTVLVAMVKSACKAMADVLNRSPTNFPEYTLHDEHHAIRVVYLMGELIPDDVFDRLTPVDLALLVLAAFGHDTGMAVGSITREEQEKTPEYRKHLLRAEAEWLEAEQARKNNDHARARHIDALIYQDFLRARHHLLSADLMTTQFRPRLEVEGKSLAGAVAVLCKSHGVSTEDVAKLPPFPFAGRFKVDMPFLACVLRLADYLDLDAARAPRSLMDLIGIKSVVSMREWHKHQASNFCVSPTAIEFQAEFDDFFQEKALRDTLDGIDLERRRCMELLLARADPKAHRLTLDNPVASHIKSDGYRFETFRFSLEYREIMSLLMGTRLYKDERVFLRELLQNALDACRHAEAALTAAGRRGHAGRITVRRRVLPDGRHVIEVQDNGAGMSPAIIRDYFMRVGRSYYQSLAFRFKKLSFRPVSQFGIGVLSCFMVADDLEVETVPDPLVHPPEDQTVTPGTRLEIRGPHEFFVVRDLERPEPGTLVRVFLRRPLAEALDRLVGGFLSRVPYTVEVQDLDAKPVELRNVPFDFSDPLFQNNFAETPNAFGYKTKDLVFDEPFGFGPHGRVRFFLLSAGGRRSLQLQNAGKYSFVGFNRVGETLVTVKQLTDEIRTSLHKRLASVRDRQKHFTREVQADIDGILRHLERAIDRLDNRHDGGEAKALTESLVAQRAALAAAAAFKSNPVAIFVVQDLDQAIHEIAAFVTGRFLLAQPAGVLTQDGIPVTDIFQLPERLQLGIGFLYNLDLCGEHRLSLNAARDDVVPDTRLDALIEYFHGKIGNFLGEWFREESLAPADLAEYLRTVPQGLALSVEQAYSRAVP